jgi:hypothetical protein
VTTPRLSVAGAVVADARVTHLDARPRVVVLVVVLVVVVVVVAPAIAFIIVAHAMVARASRVRGVFEVFGVEHASHARTHALCRCRAFENVACVERVTMTRHAPAIDASRPRSTPAIDARDRRSTHARPRSTIDDRSIDRSIDVIRAADGAKKTPPLARAVDKMRRRTLDGRCTRFIYPSATGSLRWGLAGSKYAR